MFSLILSENVYAQKHWSKDYMEISWDNEMNCIILKMTVYDYLFAGSAHGYLMWSTVDASVDGSKYYKIFTIFTARQNWSYTTTTTFRSKDYATRILFLDNVVSPSPGSLWPSYENLKVTVTNLQQYANVTLALRFGRHDIRYINISGNWHVDAPNKSFNFEDVVYSVNKTGQSKVETPEINTTVLKNNQVKVFDESEPLVIKGADIGTNIKFNITSRFEVKSVISNNDIVKTKLSEKQIYIVHVGKSRYKVAL